MSSRGYFTKDHFSQVPYIFKRRVFCDYKVRLFSLTLNKLNLSRAYFGVQKPTERIVYLFPSTVFKQCFSVAVFIIYKLAVCGWIV